MLFFNLLTKKAPNPLSSTLPPSFRVCSIALQNISIIFSISELLILGLSFFKWLINLALDNYFSFFAFFPIAFSKIPLSVAPDFVAPSPNFAMRDFSSSI